MAEYNIHTAFKTRELFGIQLEVTSLLLNTEMLKLSSLKTELEFCKNNKNFHPQLIMYQEDQQLQLIYAISRIQAQVDQLEREYTSRALGLLKSAPLRRFGKINRSQPAIGLKDLPKLRPSIFGTVASSPTATSDGSPGSTYIQKSMMPQSLDSTSGSGSSGACSRISSSEDKSVLSSLSSSSSASQRPKHVTIAADSASSSPSESHSHSSSSHLSTNHGSNLKSVNNWEHTLVYENTNLISGTLEGLIQHLVPTETYYADRAFIFAFLLSSRLYIRPHELLGHIFKVAFPSQHNSSKYISTKETKVVSNFIRLLREWAELFPYDFRDERMMAHVRTITQRCVALDPPIRKDVSQLLTALLARLTALERYEDFIQRINTEAALGDPVTAQSILSICPNPTMLAQQLTHIELERLSHIGPEEFVQAFAKDSTHVETNYNDMKKTRNLECYVQWFNRLSYYVATEICKVHRKKSRIRVVEYWIEAARECFNVGNFNSLMAIIAGLNMSPVARLKKTWNKVSNAQLSILEHQMDPTANFSSYRSTLNAAVWRSAGATDERQRIVIPFFSLLVKDLYFLNEGCASKLTGGNINFEKFWQFAKQVTEVITWQQITCSFPKVQTVLSSLHTAPVFSENALCLASFECEAADTSQEKERLKYLRREESGNIEITDCLPRSKHFKMNSKRQPSTNDSMSSSNGGSHDISSKV